MDFFERPFGAPLLDHYLINLDKPDSWGDDTPMRRWVDGQRAKGRRGTVKFYDSDKEQVEKETKELDSKPVHQVDQSKDPVVQRHESLLYSMKREHLRKNVRPVIKWEQDGNAWKGLGGPHLEGTVKLWDEWYYVASVGFGKPDSDLVAKPKFIATYEDKQGVYEIGQYGTLGEGVRACNRANALKHKERAKALKV